MSVDRLTIEAGKYHGMTAGESIDKSEVKAQAEANGYSSSEARAMLDGKGHTIEIPEQGNLFGEQWPGNQNDDLITQPENTVRSFREWIDRRRKDNVMPYEDNDGKMAPRWFNPEHNWSHEQARKNFGRAKDAERFFWGSYEEFTTVHVVRTADDNTEPLLEQTESLSPRAYDQSRRRLLNRLSDDYSGNYAAVRVRAPKYPTHAENTVRTHIHEGYWLPGHHSAEEFELLRNKHMEKVPGATDACITVEHHSADTYPPVEHGLDGDRGATSALPYELAGRNQPLMNVDRDAADLYDERALEWCATLSASHDGQDLEAHRDQGKSYWTELGSFSEYAEATKEGREESDDSITQPENTVGSKDDPKPESTSQPASEAMRGAVSKLARL